MGDWGEVGSSGSPLYRGIPSAPTSIMGGKRKFCLCRYSGEISSEASSGMVEGQRSFPARTSSIE